MKSSEAVLSSGDPQATDEEIQARLNARLRKQERLHGPAPATYWFILDELALRRPVGGLQVMRDQLVALLTVGALPHVTIQVLPFSAGDHSEMGGSLTLLTLPDRSVVGYEEGSRSGFLVDDPAGVTRRQALYDLLRAQALSPKASAAMISAATEEFTHAIR